MMLRMVLKSATPIGITLQRLIIYTLASLVVITLPQFQSMHMCELQTKHSSTYVGGANTTNLGLWYLSKNLLHMVKLLGQAT